MLLTFSVRRSVILLIIAVLLTVLLIVLTAPHALATVFPAHLLVPAQGGGVGG